MSDVRKLLFHKVGFDGFALTLQNFHREVLMDRYERKISQNIELLLK